MTKSIATATDTEILYLQGLELGMPPEKAAAYAGEKNKTVFLRRSREKEYFVAEERRIQEAHKRAMNMSRSRVQSILLEAVEMARLISDPNAMIRAAAEINKMCGYHAPEKHIFELGERAQEMKNKIEQKADDELLAFLDEDAIDVDFTDISSEADEDAYDGDQ
jgi:hypothetical protein